MIKSYVPHYHGKSKWKQCLLTVFLETISYSLVSVIFLKNKAVNCHMPVRWQHAEQFVFMPKDPITHFSFK